MQALPSVTGIAGPSRGVSASEGTLVALGALQVANVVLIQEAQALIAGILIGLWVLAAMVVTSPIRRRIRINWIGTGQVGNGRVKGLPCGAT